MDSNTSKVTELKPDRRRYDYRFRGRATTIQIEGAYLHERWKKSQFESGEKVYLLHQLSPILRKGQTVNPAALSRARWGIGLLLGAAVVFFSEYHDKLPLAAPILALASLAPLISGLRGLLPADSVQICDDYNAVEVSIPIAKGESDAERQKREAFLEALKASIEVAREEYFEE